MIGEPLWNGVYGPASYIEWKFHDTDVLRDVMAVLKEHGYTVVDNAGVVIHRCAAEDAFGIWIGPKVRKECK